MDEPENRNLSPYLAFMVCRISSLRPPSSSAMASMESWLLAPPALVAFSYTVSSMEFRVTMLESAVSSSPLAFFTTLICSSDLAIWSLMAKAFDAVAGSSDT
jgi:hypothetical protein